MSIISTLSITLPPNNFLVDAILRSHNMKKRRLLASSTLTVLAIATSPAFATQANQAEAEASVERIVVTADLFQRNLSELPATALLLNQQEIETRQARHLQDLIGMVPNLNVTAGASRGKFVQIRGIGERSQFQEPINPSIGILLDDIDISGIGGLATVYDLAQVEVLSGPQSVATGLNSLGGIVKLVSNAPSKQAYANITASYAQFNESRIAATYTNGLSENISARFSLQQTKSDGFVYNAFLNTDDTNNIDETTITGRFNIVLSEQTALDLNVYHFDIDNGYDVFSLDNDNVTLSDEPGVDKLDATAASLKLSHNFSEHTLQISLFQLSADSDYSYDEDWTYDGFDPNGYMSFDRFIRDISRRGVDLKIASIERGSKHAYLIGANISSHEEDLLRKYTYQAQDYMSHYNPTQQSIYGQYIYALNDKTHLTGAARVEWFEADFEDNNAFIERLNDTLVAGSVAIDYQLANNLLFASISRGYKAGGFNVDQRLNAQNRVFSPEYNDNYELGIKGRAYNGMADLNLTFFYMQRDDAQVSDYALFTPEEGGPNSFADVIGNAGSGINKGIELSSTWYVSDAWYISANLGYLDATIGDYLKADGTYVPKDKQAQAPAYSAYLASNWQINQQLSWFLDVDIKDEFRFSDGHQEKAPFTTIVNTELAWKSSGKHLYRIKLWVKNLADRKVYTRGFGGFSNDPRDGYANPQPYYQFGQERQLGITFMYEWE